MGRSKVLRLALMATCMAAVLAFVGAVRSCVAYEGRDVVLKSIKALEPLDVKHTLRFLTPQLAPSADIPFVESLVGSLHHQATTLHQAWLRHTEIGQEMVLRDLLLWSLATVASIVGAVAIHRARRSVETEA